MPASANIRGPAYINYLCFQCNLSHGADIVRAKARALAKCSAGAPWLVCGSASASFAKGYSVKCVFTRATRALFHRFNACFHTSQTAPGWPNVPNLVFVAINVMYLKKKMTFLLAQVIYCHENAELRRCMIFILTICYYN